MSAKAAQPFLATYYAVQAIATFAWWAWMFNSPASRKPFFAPGTADVLLEKFSVPDLGVFGILGLVTAVLLILKSHWAMAAAWATAGASAYACVGAVMINWPIGQRPLADLLMALTMACSFYAAALVRRSFQNGK